MKHAARAIIIEDDKLLVMKRIKGHHEYYTLVGGLAKDGEPIEDALRREVHEETGLVITDARQVFAEIHPAPYNSQSIFLCNVAPHKEVAIQAASDEAMLERFESNIHEPLWVSVSVFSRLSFLTPALQKAIVRGLEKGFPDTATQI